ncbi:outer membrane porin, OprD family [Pseudomonas fluorescens]|uniref:Outer membrane porin, OprD family n=1 Tax=Pseudomonas fluorescens TaxID=294 RepID=A0A327MRC5_PSEFL|nr:OprD family porin [Pseudomonas fluorescens]RAI65437.1 outer membrane porin, OprD family [Pseudomonas fluorescens]
MCMMKWNIVALSVAASISPIAMAASQDDSKGFVDDSTLSILTRLQYMNRDFKHGYSNPTNGGKSGYRQDTGLAERVKYNSGFTQGTIGVGVDAYAMGTVKLDGGKGRAGNGMFQVDNDGSEAKTQSTAGGVIKFRVSDTVAKYGNQVVVNPVFSTGDSRLLPEVATGTLVTSNEIKGLELNAGHFTALRTQTGQFNDSAGLESINFGSATYKFTPELVAGFAASDVENHFKKQYIETYYNLPIVEGQALNFSFNGYHTKRQGQALSGKLDNNLWSLATAYSVGAHKFTVAYQRSSGDTHYANGVDGSDTVYVSNSIQMSDFDGEQERSWQGRYDLDMAGYGVPGLSFMTRYVYGDNIRTTEGPEGRERELNVEVRYVVQDGPAKDLSLRVRAAYFRANDAYILAANNNDIGPGNDDIRLIINYPLNIF